MPREVPCRSPWIEQLDTSREPRPLTESLRSDIVVIGAGIAGVSTAFFLLRDTEFDVALIERGRAGHGATGHNAGQLTTYFERPLHELVDTYGFDQAIAAQRDVDGAAQLLDEMVAECGATAPIDRFVGHMGMFTLDHVLVHLRSIQLRRLGGLSMPACVVADDARFLAEIPDEFAGLYTVVSRAHVHDLLGTSDPRYCAAISDRKGCANGALVVEQVLEHLSLRYAGRFVFADSSGVDRVLLGDQRATVVVGTHLVDASRVVMCTNGFVDHVIENLVGDDIDPYMHHRVARDVGYMVGFVDPVITAPTASSFIRNELIGGDIPYAYVTRRPYRSAVTNGMLTCIGGPETMLDDGDAYDESSGFPVDVIDEVDAVLVPILGVERSPGSTYDYAWHGLMGYTESGIRLIGAEPRNGALLYNLGCNGVGFLPSVFGGHRIAQIVGGSDLGPSIFDPR